MRGYDIVRLRMAAGLRQYELAALVGIHPSRLSLIETGRQAPDDATRRRLVEVLASRVPLDLIPDSELTGVARGEPPDGGERGS